MNESFVKTKDKQIAEKLRRLNYQELAHEGEFFVFINNPQKVVFADDETIKLIYTDKLCI